MTRIILVFLCIVFIMACSNLRYKSSEASLDYVSKKEAREDFVKLVKSYELQEKIENSISADIETKPIKAAKMDDAADDPAIWVNPKEPSNSLVFGSNKKGGIAAYDLQGNEVAYYSIGNINNVDIIYNFPTSDSLITILGCSNRSTQSIDLFEIDLTGQLHHVLSKKVNALEIDDIYGFCFAKDLPTRTSYCIINGKNGHLQQFEMKKVFHGISLNLSKSLHFKSQTEGMVADNKMGFLYVGEESKGIWKMPINPHLKNSKTLLKNSGQTNDQIVFDIEGLSLYEKEEEGFLIASSQGNFSYAIFDRNGKNEYLGSFKIRDGRYLDGVEETDGIAIVDDSLSVHFPQGMIVVQDGFNYDDKDLQPQNFKYVNWMNLKGFIDDL